MPVPRSAMNVRRSTDTSPAFSSIAALWAVAESRRSTAAHGKYSHAIPEGTIHGFVIPRALSTTGSSMVVMIDEKKLSADIPNQFDITNCNYRSSTVSSQYPSRTSPLDFATSPSVQRNLDRPTREPAAMERRSNMLSRLDIGSHSGNGELFCARCFSK